MDYNEIKHKIDWLTDTLVEWSKENTAGMPLQRYGIRNLVRDVEEYWGGEWEVDPDQIEEFMENHSNGSGFLVKASDVVAAFIKYEKDIKREE